MYHLTAILFKHNKLYHLDLSSYVDVESIDFSLLVLLKGFVIITHIVALYELYFVPKIFANLTK